MKTVKLKRIISGIFMTIGILFVAAAIILTFYNIWDDSRARIKANSALEQIDQIRQSVGNENKQPGKNGYFGGSEYLGGNEQSSQLDSVDPSDMEMPVVQINGLDYIGTLTIPAINIDLPVLKDLDYTNLRIAPCHYAGSVYSNNMVIAGHNYTSHLGPIGNLRPGDEVIFTDMANNVFRYEVAELDTLEKTAVDEMQSGEWDFTLFTCTLSGNARVTVRCNLSEN